jgi:Spy/CpxP family protein refolding chaperone
MTLAVVCALALAGAGARAEDAKAKPERGSRMLEGMKDKLGLSDDQAGKLKAAFEAQKAAAKPVREQMKVSLEKLKWQVDSKADAKDISATLASVDQARKALRDQREKFAGSLSSILTPEQRAKMALHMMAPRGRGGWSGHGGMKGGRHHDHGDKGRGGDHDEKGDDD